MAAAATVAGLLLVAACGSGGDSRELDAGASAPTSVNVTSSSTDSATAVASSTTRTATDTSTDRPASSAPEPPVSSSPGAASGPVTTIAPSAHVAPPADSRPPPPSPPATAPDRPLPGFTSAARGIDVELAAAMTGVSWHEGCPVPLTDLRLVEVAHVGFDGQHRAGRLVVHADAVAAVTDAFRQMYVARFPIERVTLVDDVGGSDDAAMAANLTTAFNCRAVTGGTGWSEHSYGRAIDINPLQNPYVTPRGTVLPPGGRAHLDRGVPAVGLIVEGGPAVAAFDAVGWQWGGRWRSIKDYQHFSPSGR